MVKKYCAMQYKLPPLLGPLKATFIFRLERAKSNKTSYPTSKRSGDIDNTIKGLTDALNQMLYEDDSQIIQIVAEKRWCEPDEKPGTALVIQCLT